MRDAASNQAGYRVIAHRVSGRCPPGAERQNEIIEYMIPDLEYLGEDKRINALREAIRCAFPPVPFTGKITRHDGAWLPELTEENAVHDDDMFVYEALNGREWPDVEDQFLHNEPDGFVLLTDEALRAYLGAWLVCSLDNMGGENNVREFLVYSFSPSPDQLPDMTAFKVSQLRALRPEQRSVVRALLVEFARREVSAFIRNHASAAIELIDSLSASPQP